MTPSPIVGASAHRWPMDLRTDALRNHHPRMPQYSVEQSFVSCRNILGLSKTYAPALLERACAKLNAASALPSYTGLKNAILAIKSSDAEERAKGRPVGAAGSGELVSRAKSAGRLRGADAYKRGGE